MALTVETLEAVLQKGDEQACVALFGDATEEERARVAECAVQCLKRESDVFLQTSPGGFSRNPRNTVATIAVLASCSFSQIKKLGRHAIPLAEHINPVFAARRPSWLRDWAAMILEKFPQLWSSIRPLVRDGLCQRPETDNYWLGMLSRWNGPRLGFGTVREGLLADRELLDEVWRLFEIEGGGELSLAARDKYTREEDTWETALVELAKQGKLDRGRLLDASLDTLGRDFAQFRASWFSRFHEAMQPTVAERAERADRYLQLLASKIPPTVSFALNALEVLDKAGKLPAGAVVTHIAPALVARQKGTVLEAQASRPSGPTRT
jgi:hypothetical protein